VSPEKGICDSDGEACVVGEPTDPCVFGGGTCEQIGQFRVLLTPDGKIWPGYKLNASNPGQYYYNLFHVGTPDTTVRLDITVPYPFVTQGAVPVHVFNGALVQTSTVDCVEGRFLPPAEALDMGTTEIGIEDYINGTVVAGELTCDEVCGPNGSGNCELTVLDVPIPGSGIAYVNVHLDYGLKGSQLDVNPCDDGLADRYDGRGPLDPVFGGFDALVNDDDTCDDSGTCTISGEMCAIDADCFRTAIADCTTYAFSHTDYTTQFEDAIQNLNTFKRISGVYGMAMASDSGSPVAGEGVELVRVSTGELVGNGVTDADGFYTITYKHKGKRANYNITLNGGYDITQRIQLKANGWAEVNFDVFTGTSTGEFNLNPNGGGRGGPGDCTATEDPEVTCNDGVDNDCDGDTDLEDTDCNGGFCTDAQLGDPCTVDSDCCSNKCRGRSGNKVCK
jgi:hypothetical protein